MELEKMKKRLAVLMRGMIVNAVILIVGMVFVMAVLVTLQRQYSVKQTRNTLSRSLSTVMDALDTNADDADALNARVHRDNQAIVNTLAGLVYNPNGSGQYRSDPAALANLATVVGGNCELLVVGKDGQVMSASNKERMGQNLVQNGTFTEAQIDLLLRRITRGNQEMNGTSIYTYNGSTVIQAECEPVRTSFEKESREAYFYSSTQAEGEALIFKTYANTLSTLMADIGDIGTILSGAAMENNGFLFAINKDGIFTYFHDGGTVLTGEPFSASGLTAEVLNDGYSGTQTINGIAYQCQSMTYSSELYGDGVIVSAVQPDQDVARANLFTSIFIIVVFAGMAIIIMIYTMFLKVDPEQIVGYDDKLIKGNGKERRKAVRNDISIKNVEAFRLLGRQYYFKLGVAKRIAPVIVLGLAIIFIVSWNAQRITMLTKNMTAADSAVEQLAELFESSNQNAELLTSAYEQHYLSKIKLISYLVETEPDALNGRVSRVPGNDVMYTYLDDRFNPLLDQNGKPITSVSNSTTLMQYANRNGIDEIFIFDDHGHIIASSNDIWNFTLSADPEDQSYDFRKILTGEASDIIQKPMVNDVGNARQYMGTTIYYCTLQGSGEYDGLYVPSAAYEDYAANGVYTYEGEPYEVVYHRGLIQAGISDTRIDRIMETTEPAYLMQQFEVGDGGYAMIFDNSQEHICLWSPVSSDIGKTAEAIGISSNGFSGYYRGFAKTAGTKYLQYITFGNDFWVALNMPQDSVFAGDFRIALLSTAISAVFYLIMFCLCTVSNEHEEIALEALFENIIENEENNGMVKVVMANGKVKYVRSASAKYHSSNIGWSSMTVNQKMAQLINGIATLLGLAFIAVTLFEEQFFGTSSAFHYILTGNWDKGLNYYACFYCVVVLIYIVVVASIVSAFISFITKNLGSRVETLGRLLLSVIKYGSVLFGVFYSLTVLGISTSGVVTSAGIFSVVVGLGAQSLISDILSGIFIIFEGAFRVGDIVEISGFWGYVREIGIRTTLVEDYHGDIKIFNNSQISGILNHTKKDSFATCKVGISYNENIERVEEVIRSNLPKLNKKIPGLIGDLYYAGVLRLDDSAVIIGIGGRCNEGEKRFFMRSLQREVLILFRDNNINIPFPQLTISYENTPEETQPAAGQDEQR